MRRPAGRRERGTDGWRRRHADSSGDSEEDVVDAEVVDEPRQGAMTERDNEEDRRADDDGRADARPAVDDAAGEPAGGGGEKRAPEGGGARPRGELDEPRGRPRSAISTSRSRSARRRTSRTTASGWRASRGAQSRGVRDSPASCCRRSTTSSARSPRDAAPADADEQLIEGLRLVQQRAARGARARRGRALRRGRRALRPGAARSGRAATGRRRAPGEIVEVYQPGYRLAGA